VEGWGEVSTDHALAQAVSTHNKSGLGKGKGNKVEVDLNKMDGGLGSKSGKN